MGALRLVHEIKNNDASTLSANRQLPIVDETIKRVARFLNPGLKARTSTVVVPSIVAGGPKGFMLGVMYA